MVKTSLKKSLTPLQTARLLAHAAINKKALDPVILDLKEHSDIADYFVIASGRTDVQVNAIYQEMERVCREHHIGIFRAEGYEQALWIVLDLGNVMVHLFRENERNYYRLENLWDKAERVKIAPV